MDDNLKREIDQLYRTVNVLRAAVTKLQLESAGHQQKVEKIERWAKDFVHALEKRHVHQKAEIDELYRCAEAMARKHDIEFDILRNQLVETTSHANLALDKLYPKQLGFEKEIYKIIGDPVWGRNPPKISGEPTIRTKS